MADLAETVVVALAPTAERKFAPDGMHLLRTTQQIQYQLSQMADQKASMLLGITFVIFTIAVGQIKTGEPKVAVLVLAVAAFAAAILTVLAVLPSVKTPPQIHENGNILFFGTYTQMPEKEYIARMLDIVTDTQAVYEAFAHDIYQNGQVLAGKKYKLLGYAYRVLLAGLVCSLVAFLIPFLFAILKR